MATPTTLSDIDIEIIAASWACSHAHAQHEDDLETEARGLLDELLEIRYQLMASGPLDWPT